MRQRDEMWMRDLWTAHAGTIHRFVRRRTPDLDPEDITAEAFLTAWRRRDDVPDDALPWLYACARNIIGTRIRSAGRHRALLATLATEHETEHDDVARERVDLARAWSTLSGATGTS